MTEHDFEKGGVIFGKFFPGLKVPAVAVRVSKNIESMYFDYEPGNMTRYQVLFSDLAGQRVVMTIVNMRKAMELSGPMNETSIGYMEEKLGLNAGDCYALIPLINHYFDERGQ
jgi:hypothetical protein